MKQSDIVHINVKYMLRSILQIITNEENKDLVCPIEEDEIKNAISIPEPDKVPWPDEFSILFFRFF